MEKADHIRFKRGARKQIDLTLKGSEEVSIIHPLQQVFNVVGQFECRQCGDKKTNVYSDFLLKYERHKPHNLKCAIYIC